MIKCSKADTCMNYPDRCVACGMTSDIINHHPYFQDKKDLQKAYDEGYAQGVKDFAERVKNYYRHTTSRPLPATVEYYIDQIEKEMLKEEKGNE